MLLASSQLNQLLFPGIAREAYAMRWHQHIFARKVKAWRMFFR
jgi:hypothetical protein